MKELENFRKAYNELTNAFCKKYYWEDAYIENELEETDRFLHFINISDEWWSLDDIYLAIVLDVPKEIVLKWFDYNYEKCWKEMDWEIEHRINFYTFIKTYGNTSI